MGKDCCVLVDGIHHQAGVGAAKAETVVERRLDRARLCLVRDEVNALGALVGIVEVERRGDDLVADREDAEDRLDRAGAARSEEHTSELQSLMRISYAVFCLKKKTKNKSNT